MDHDPNYLKLLAVASELARCRDVVIACRSRVPLAVDRRGLGRVMYDLNAAIHDVTIAALRQEYTTVVCLRPPPSEDDAHRAWQPSSVEHWLDVPRLDLSPSDSLWTAQSRYDLLRGVTETLFRIYHAIPSLASTLARIGDREILVDGCKTDLRWAAENCAVVAEHQIGRKFKDDMGLSGMHELKYARPVDSTPVQRIDLDEVSVDLVGTWRPVPTNDEIELECVNKPITLSVQTIWFSSAVAPTEFRSIFMWGVSLRIQQLEYQFGQTDFARQQEPSDGKQPELRLYGRADRDGARLALASRGDPRKLVFLTIHCNSPEIAESSFLDLCTAIFDRMTLKD